MKRILTMAALFILAVSCGQNKAQKALVLYYSQLGNTKAVAEQIQAATGADIEEIVPVIPYDGDFMATIERGRKELEEGTVPEIQPVKADLADYDVVFLGFPVWFGTCANPVLTVLSELDFSGKKIVPFCTFGSGGLDSSVAAIKEKQPDAESLPGYGVRAARIEAVPAELDRFLKAGGFIEGEYVVPGEFSEEHDASAEEAAIFDAAVGDYPMMHARATKVASREVPGGVEYLFTAEDLPREGAPAAPDPAMPPRALKVYVLAEDGQAPVFTQVIR